jgi:hypothetical protein
MLNSYLISLSLYKIDKKQLTNQKWRLFFWCDGYFPLALPNPLSTLLQPAPYLRRLDFMEYNNRFWLGFANGQPPGLWERGDTGGLPFLPSSWWVDVFLCWRSKSCPVPIARFGSLPTAHQA